LPASSQSDYNHGMKFSVKSLLVITLFVALTINGCNTFSKLAGLQVENAKLQSRLSIYRNQTVNFEERKLLFERAIEATAKRMRDFEKACKEHKEVVEKSDRRQANGSGVNDD